MREKKKLSKQNNCTEPNASFQENNVFFQINRKTEVKDGRTENTDDKKMPF